MLSAAVFVNNGLAFRKHRVKDRYGSKKKVPLNWFPMGDEVDTAEKLQSLFCMCSTGHPTPLDRLLDKYRCCNFSTLIQYTQGSEAFRRLRLWHLRTRISDRTDLLSVLYIDSTMKSINIQTYECPSLEMESN